MPDRPGTRAKGNIRKQGTSTMQMQLIDRVTSLATLLSIFMITPILGRALSFWWTERRPRSALSTQIAPVFGTAVAILVLASVYGVLWKINPRSIAWYDWISRDIPIAGEVSGNVSAAIEDQPIKVEIER
jgi:hypothetical protein